MATNTHTTATVKLSLDLGELITQLRTLADTLETSQQPKAEEGPTAAECKARWYINPNNPNGFTPEAVEALVDAEMRRARHRLPDGDFPCCAPEPASAPEPANYTDGTQPYRNPHTLDLPEGIDPAEAQHILRLADDALKARTQPIVFAAGDTSKPRAFVATRITPDHPALNLGVDSDGLRCTRCEHPYHRRGICPTCGCDH